VQRREELFRSQSPALHDLLVVKVALSCIQRAKRVQRKEKLFWAQSPAPQNLLIGKIVSVLGESATQGKTFFDNLRTKGLWLLKLLRAVYRGP
jgi:hypothetical protein